MGRLIGAGLISGLILGFFFKWIQAVTGKKVYLLLFNVDYIPFVKDISLSETGEFLLHLTVSIPVAVFLLKAVPFLSPHKSVQTGVLLLGSLFIGIILYPTTVLSARTPALSDGQAFFWWILGHCFYGAALAVFLPRRFRNTPSNQL